MYRKQRALFVLIILSLTSTSGKEMTDIEALAAKPTHCTYEYAYDMYGAHCAGLQLPKIPNLRSGIEILDFSDNKLQEIHSDTFSSYTSIKFLYLAENKIYLIDDDAFTSLTDLVTLDLSNNVIFELSNSIFQLPSLRKLYLKGNPLLHRSLSHTSITKPIRAPLELLDLSDCKIQKLPNWGYLPQLVFYNISYNSLISLDAKHFAEMCNLAKVDLSDSINNIKLCDLKPSIWWFQEKQIFFQLVNYNRLNTREFENCPNVNNTEIYNGTYNRCKAEYLQVQKIRATRRTWLTISGSLAGFLVGFILLLYVMHRHNVAQIKTKSEKLNKTAPPRDADPNSTSVLLNDVS